MSDTTTKSLDPRDITSRPINRRAAMLIIGAGAVVTAVGAQACASSGCTDHDIGAGGDPGGNGRHCCTDHDSGSGADTAGHGAHC